MSDERDHMRSDEIGLCFGEGWEFKHHKSEHLLDGVMGFTLSLRRVRISPTQPFDNYGFPVMLKENIELKAVVWVPIRPTVRAFYEAWGQYFKEYGEAGVFEYTVTS
jgi:hypothetical protein